MIDDDRDPDLVEPDEDEPPEDVLDEVPDEVPDEAPDDAPHEPGDSASLADVDDTDDTLALKEDRTSSPAHAEAPRRRSASSASTTPTSKRSKGRTLSPTSTQAKARRLRRETAHDAPPSRKSPIVRAADKTAAGVKKAAGWARAVSGEARRAVVDGAKSERELRTLQILLASTAALALLFLVLAIIGFSSSVEDDEAALLAQAAASQANAGEDEQLASRVAELEAALTAANGLIADLKSQRASTEDTARTLESALEKARSEVASLKSRAREGAAAADKEVSPRTRELEAELDDVRAELSAAKLETATSIERERRAAAEVGRLEDDRDRIEGSVSEAEAREAELRERVLTLEAELRTIEDMLPPEPLSHVEAGRRFRMTVDDIQNEPDRAERVARLRDLEFTLAGTRYAQAVARLRENELKLMDRDGDVAAATVYRTVARHVRTNKNDREGNLAALHEALKKVEGSEKYTALIQALIERQSAEPSD